MKGSALEKDRKASRYERIMRQLEELVGKSTDLVARMATVAAVVHHKQSAFSWTGFYLLRDGDLVVGPYQGPVACLVLRPRHTGVCWAGVDRGETVVVPDVHAFPGHIACDARSRSEIVVPLRDSSGRVAGVLDVDSTRPAAFDEVDAEWLERAVALVVRP